MNAENRPEIIATTKRSWILMDSSKPEFESFMEIPAGTHRLKMIDSPYGEDGKWFVLEGTKIGKPMESWLVFQDRTDEFEVRIEGSVPPPAK